MSRLGLLGGLKLRPPYVTNIFQFQPLKMEPVSSAPILISFRGLKMPKKAAGGSGGAKGKKGAAMVKPDLDVETDAFKLVNYVCGLNYRIDEGHTEPVKLRVDSEYPDWLWTINTNRPLPPLEEQDPNTKAYWLQVQRDMRRHRNRLMKVYNKK